MPLKRSLLVAVALVVAGAAPLASARTLALPTGTVTLEAAGPSGTTFDYDNAGFTCTPPPGATFPITTTTVNCVDANQVPSGTFDVKVVDTTPPVVTPPANQTMNTGNPNGTTVTYGSGSATDAVAISPPVTCTPASGSNFGVGSTTVTCSASDGVNTGTATFTVTVNLVDTTPPTLSVPGSITAQATGPGGAAVTFSVTATDAVDPSPTISCDHASGSTFPLGVTTITCTAQDASNNTSPPGSFSITVLDTTPPTFTSIPSGTVTQQATGPTGAGYSFTVSATDAVTASPTINCDHNPAGATYGLGSTSVSCTATDGNGNGTTQGFVVSVVDTTPPTITSAPSGTVALDATSPAGASYSFTVTASDPNGVDPSPAIICNHGPSSQTYPIGITPVSCQAKDASNNLSAASTFTVDVKDRSAPTISVPAPITKEATGPNGAAVTFSVTASDSIDPAPSTSCSSASGAVFPISTTTVTCTANDSSGNTSPPKSFTVSVRDTTAPAIAQPANRTAEATGPSGAAVTYPAVTATDIVDGTIAASCSPSSGTTFRVGNSTVTCNATDGHGNSAPAKSFTITIADTTAPVFSGVPSPIVREANGPSGSIVNWAQPTAVDLVDGPIPGAACSPASGTLFAIAATTVNCSATDAHGNTGRASFQVEVRDTTPPNLIVPAAYTINATTPTGIPNTVGGIPYFASGASATDIVDPNPVVTNNVPGFILVGTSSIRFTARDASGNSVSRDVTLVVRPQPPAGTPQLPLPASVKPPADVANVKVTAGDGSMRLVWSAVAEAVRYIVFRSESGKRTTTAEGQGQVVYTGTATRFTDRGLTNGAEYRYVVVSEDAAGNHSAGVAIVVVPRRNLLRSPKDGARLRKPPRLAWAADAEADYYNAQLLLNGLKVLSAWPVSASFPLKKSWTYEGRKHKLSPGLYTWYVWPGYGARAAVHYGALLGSRTFRIVR